MRDKNVSIRISKQLWEWGAGKGEERRAHHDWRLVVLMVGSSDI